MVTSPARRGGKRPHPAWRARRVTAVVSGVAFVGLTTGMAVEASASTAQPRTTTPDPVPNDPGLATTQPTWAAPLSAPPTFDTQTVPQTVLPPVRHRAHTQTSGS